MLFRNSLRVLFSVKSVHWQNLSQFRYSSHMKVTVCGATGHIGQPLCLMLKQSHLIDELALYDHDETNGLALELTHIDTKCKVTSFQKNEMSEALKNSNVVAVISASKRTCNREIKAMFEPNALVIKDVMENIAKYCPKALIALATNPVNSMLPLASEVMVKSGIPAKNRMFGVTTLNVIRTNTFVAETLGLEPECVMVPVIGGCTATTIVPLLSHAKPCSDFSLLEIEKITKAVQTAHMDILKIKLHDSATLSTAFAIARFAISLVKGIKGHPDVVECAYVRTDEHPNTKYLALPILLGPNGIQKHYPVPELTEYEQCLLEKAIPLIVKEVKQGEKYMGIVDPAPCDPCDPSPKMKSCPPVVCRKTI